MKLDVYAVRVAYQAFSNRELLRRRKNKREREREREEERQNARPVDQGTG